MLGSCPHQWSTNGLFPTFDLRRRRAANAALQSVTLPLTAPGRLADRRPSPTRVIATVRSQVGRRKFYDVLDAQNQVIGTATYRATTSLKPPFTTSYSLVQKDIAGKVIVELRW